jgi:hypothetical protein
LNVFQSSSISSGGGWLKSFATTFLLDRFQSGSTIHDQAAGQSPNQTGGYARTRLQHNFISSARIQETRQRFRQDSPHTPYTSKLSKKPATHTSSRSGVNL